MPRNFADQLADAVRRRANPVCVGLDPRWESLPAPFTRDRSASNLAHQADAYRLFCRDVIDVVAGQVPAVKPQAAFFEQLGPPGLAALADVIAHASAAGLLVVLDGKRNDIGSTATAYAEGYLGRGGLSPWGADALTVTPYLGEDSLRPFVDVAQERGAGVFVLVKTSNPGGGLFQDIASDGLKLYERVGRLVESLAQQTQGSCGYGAVGAVVGATYPEQLTALRQALPHTWFLVPGYGHQGGGAPAVAGAFDDAGLGALINNARGIIFAHQSREFASPGDDKWQSAVDVATRRMIVELREATTAGRLAGHAV